MTPMLRHARRIKPALEVALTGRRLAALVIGQIALLALAFLGGFFVADRPSTPPPFRAPAFAFRDPLAALDQEVRSPQYTFHERLTARRPDAAPEPAVAQPMERAQAKAPTAAPQRRRARRRRNPRRVDAVHALEAQVRRFVAASARQSVRSQPNPPPPPPTSQRSPASTPRRAAASTDDELRQAMRESRSRVSLSRPKAASAAPVAKRKQRRRAKRRAKRRVRHAAKYTVQVRALPERGKAQELVEHYRQRGMDAFLVAHDLPGRGRWYRVRVGRFASRSAAQSLVSRLKSSQTGAFVTLIR